MLNYLNPKPLNFCDSTNMCSRQEEIVDKLQKACERLLAQRFLGIGFRVCGLRALGIGFRI